MLPLRPAVALTFALAFLTLLAPLTSQAFQDQMLASYTAPKIEFLDASYSSAHRAPRVEVIETPPSTTSLIDEILTTRLPEGVGMDEVWVSIDLANRKLKVYRGYVPIKRLDYVAFGASGAEPLRLQGSNLTPTGEFRVDRINQQSKYRLFYGIDYPNKQVADQALEEGLITASEHRHIHTYIDRHGIAPADTSLGGYIGIHGLGSSDPEIHSLFDWTQGCVAVTNEEIQELSAFLDIGTRVVIRS